MYICTVCKLYIQFSYITQPSTEVQVHASIACDSKNNVLTILYSCPTHPLGQYQKGRSQLRHCRCHRHQGLHTVNVRWQLPIRQRGPRHGH